MVISAYDMEKSGDDDPRISSALYGRPTARPAALTAGRRSPGFGRVPAGAGHMHDLQRSVAAWAAPRKIAAPDR